MAVMAKELKLPGKWSQLNIISTKEAKKLQYLLKLA